MWDDGIIKKILPDVGRLEDRLDVMLFKNLLRTNTRKHEQFGGLKNTRRDNNLVVGAESQFLTVWTENLNTGNCVSVKKKLIRMGGREDSNIRFALHEYIAGGPEAFTNRVHAMDQAGHGAQVDIFGELFSLCSTRLWSEHHGMVPSWEEVQRARWEGDLGRF